MAEFVEADYSLCNERPFSQRDDCTAAVANATLDSMMDTLGDATDNAVNQCLVDTWENYCDWAYQEMRTTNAPIDHACENNVETAKFLLGLKGRLREGSGPDGSGGPTGYQLHTVAFLFDAPGTDGVGGRPDITFGNYNERVANFPCRDLAEQELSRHGIGVSYCDDGQRWQGGDPAYVDCDSPNEWELNVLEQ